MIKKLLKNRRTSDRRSGVATVELAICLPIFFLVLWGNIEIGRALMAKQVLINAAREGSRSCIVGGLTADQTTEIVADYALANLVSDVKVTVTPDPATAGLGEPVTVSVEVGYEKISLFAPLFLSEDAVLKAESTMRKERAN